jgi:hypothetical protein
MSSQPPPPNQFSAADPALGYLYQMRVALLWALRKLKESPDFMVSLETLDDVVFEKIGKAKELLQTKRTRLLTSGNHFGFGSKDSSANQFHPGPSCTYSRRLLHLHALRQHTSAKPTGMCKPHLPPWRQLHRRRIAKKMPRLHLRHKREVVSSWPADAPLS